MQQLLSFFLSAFMFFMSLFGFGGVQTPGPTPELPQPAIGLQQTIAYGSEERQTLDLMLPSGKQGNVGLVLFIHGGAWVTGSKELYYTDMIQWRMRGYAAASLNYRYLSSEVRIEDELDDISAALAAIKATAQVNGYNITGVIPVGMSAGAQLALLYAYTRAAWAPIRPVAVFSSSAPTDFTDPAFLTGTAASSVIASSIGIDPTPFMSLLQIDFVRQLLLPLKNISPVYQVTSSSVPTLMSHGEKDSIVPYSNAVSLDAKLTEAGVKHDFVSFPNSDHFLLGDPDCVARWQTLTQQYAASYLQG